MKKCFKCGIAKERHEFYRHPQMGDGLLGKCKSCTKHDVKTRYESKREYISAYERSRTLTPERKAANHAYQQRKRAAHPEKYKAHTAVSNAVRDGRLSKPKSCPKCGKIGRIEGHHHDYSKPLDVEWMCFACHRSTAHGQVVSAKDF